MPSLQKYFQIKLLAAKIFVKACTSSLGKVLKSFQWKQVEIPDILRQKKPGRKCEIQFTSVYHIFYIVFIGCILLIYYHFI